MIRFDGRVAIVTGAGRGIGREHAILLGERGASVVVDDISGTHADETVQTIVANGGTAVAVHETCATPEGGQKIVQRALDEFGTVDVVIHNAGSVDVDLFEDLTPDRIRAQVDVHLLGGFWVTQPAWRIMKNKRYGRVVLTGSSTGMFSHGGFTNYAASKAGLYGLMKSLAFEGRNYGICVNLLMPGATTTIMDETYQRFEDFSEFSFGPDAPDSSALFADESRWRPHLPAQAAAYLASEECTITGEAFSAWVGRYARCFVGLAEGWTAPSTEEATPEAVRDHFEEIRDLEDHIVPQWTCDESAQLIESLAKHTTISTSH
jgi:NAD(P)-dependent dehydrogenase (short-subunit alcohol dehydrogenase family)